MNIGLILAAGIGRRIGDTGIPKQFIELRGKPLLIHTLERFENSDDIDRIAIVCLEQYITHLQKLVGNYGISKVVSIVPGGMNRQESLMKGLEAVEDFLKSDDDIIVIHDGVRPLVGLQVIRDNIDAASKYDATMTALPAAETVILCSNGEVSVDGFCRRTDTYKLTSPQSFRYGSLKRAYDLMVKDTCADKSDLLDAAMVYARYIGPIHVVNDHANNIKVTTPEDFYCLKAILDVEEQRSIIGI
ncbi:2-C-methyl-D-erythritol 4-phosphate cytidylyltransferase [Lachnospiraceae bacterium XBB2008]|nr:2-C-methyl-D-erythritol 4-phosphate cytidylyltransferase [Lachnospiraceae bacterium XBB2008]